MTHKLFVLELHIVCLLNLCLNVLHVLHKTYAVCMSHNFMFAVECDGS